MLHETFGIEKGLVTAVHSYTNDQGIHDLQHKDLHRARVAALSIIPTTIGAVRAVSPVLPALRRKLDGMAMRVPAPNVSVVDLVAILKSKVDVAAVNSAFKIASKGALKGILGFGEVPLVSIDYNGSRLSSVVDASRARVIDGNMVNVIAWYDNETGFSYRLLDLLNLIASRQ